MLEAILDLHEKVEISLIPCLNLTTTVKYTFNVHVPCVSGCGRKLVYIKKHKLMCSIHKQA